MDDAYVVVYRGDGMEELSYVELAVLWGAIEALEACTYDMGYDDGNGKYGSRIVFFQARAHLRELLGLEPMPDDDALQSTK